MRPLFVFICVNEIKAAFAEHYTGSGTKRGL